VNIAIKINFTFSQLERQAEKRAEYCKVHCGLTIKCLRELLPKSQPLTHKFILIIKKMHNS